MKEMFPESTRSLLFGWCPSQYWKAHRYVSIFCQHFDERRTVRDVLMILLEMWGSQCVYLTSYIRRFRDFAQLFFITGFDLIFLGTKLPSCVKQRIITVVTGIWSMLKYWFNSSVYLDYLGFLLRACVCDLSSQCWTKPVSTVILQGLISIMGTKNEFSTFQQWRLGLRLMLALG